MIVVGGLGLLANLVAAYVLVGGRENLNVEGAFLHLVADAASSVATVAVGIALLSTDYLVLDPAFAALIAAVVLYSAWGLLADSLNILLRGVRAVGASGRRVRDRFRLSARPFADRPRRAVRSRSRDDPDRITGLPAHGRHRLVQRVGSASIDLRISLV